MQFVLELNSDFAPAHLWLGRAYQELGRFHDAIAEFRRVEDTLPGWPVPIAARGFVEAIAGHTDDARTTLGNLESLAGSRFVTACGRALVHAALGETDAAFAWLDRSFDERSHWLVWLRLDPRWKELRFDPRFGQYIRRLWFP